MYIAAIKLTLQTSEYDVMIDFLYLFRDVIQKVQCHRDLIKAHALR